MCCFGGRSGLSLTEHRLFPILTSRFFLSVSVLLATGLFTAFFIGDSILISGIKGEKKLIEKTEVEIKKESSALFDIKNELKELRAAVESLRNR